MNQNQHTDEIDLMQLFSMIKEGFRSFLKLIISVILFYKKKAILFIIILILSGGLGYFMDKYQGAGTDYVQEVIIEPKYNSTKFIYGFIEEFEDNLKDENFIKKIGIDLSEVENISEITIEPVVKGTDVLDDLQDRYENREFFKDVMEAYQEDQLKEEGFRDFYKHHLITFKFKSNKEYNNNITESILNYIKSNEYYKELALFIQKQNRENLNRNKASIDFIDKYLKNLEEAPLQIEKENVIISRDQENEMPMVSVASLLQKKELLIEMVNEQEQTLAFDQDIFTYVYNSDVISKKKKLLGKSMLSLPLVFFVIVSLIFFLRYLFREANRFVNNQ
ncbi:hypothetical protein [Aquimarina algicola]|uniref:Uncharacterized protein n=1 Tax=Aquimarina algicola TaxID=2589995 RepID=A0A504JAA2_9FLAO|nr:hypothetical protein [Aquimarina algicola]TPN87866.1 hypothetical protein FHK87_09845 [Aquimarina algicola]